MFKCWHVIYMLACGMLKQPGSCTGYEEAKALARREADLALAALNSLPVCDERRSLETMVDYVLERLY